MKTEQEKLTEAEREQICGWCTESGYEGPKALRIIDAQAAAVQALTEQVAQLTAERDEVRKQAQRERDIGQYETSLKERRLRSAAESRVTELTDQVAQLTELAIAWEDDPLVPELRAENARLTEALAAAERTEKYLRQRLETDVLDARADRNLAEARAEAAERDRDAAQTLINTFNFTDIDEWYEARTKFLEGQPAQAPTSTLGHPGADEVFARLRQARQPAAPARTEAEQAVLRVVEETPAELLHAWGAPQALIGWYHDFGVVVAQYLETKGVEAQLAGGGYEQPAAPPTEAAPGVGFVWDAIRLRYVHIAAQPAAPAPTAAEAELTALRERVAKALQYLDNTGRGATWREQQALEALRGR